MPDCSVIILTYNEEPNLRQCIESVPWRSDIIVLDSGSTDRTQEIAESMNAKFLVRQFDNFAEQRNFALSLPLENEFVVMLDADERMTEDLAAEIAREIARPSNIAMYRVRRRDYLMGRWLRRSSGYPTWFPRVFRLGRVRVQR